MTPEERIASVLGVEAPWLFKNDRDTLAAAVVAAIRSWEPEEIAALIEGDIESDWDQREPYEGPSWRVVGPWRET